MEFNPINTQEEFDNAIKSRLERNTRTVTEEVTKKFEGFLSPEDVEKIRHEQDDKITEISEKLKGNETKIAELTAKNRAYEVSSVKMKIAHEVGIPFELSEKLSGETEEEIRADAEKLAKYTAINKQSPKYSGEPKVKSEKEVALRQVLQDLKKN